MANNLMVRFPELKSEVQISKEWFEERDILINEASTISSVNDSDAFNLGALLLNKITKTSNNLEKMRKALSKPFNDSLKLIKNAADKARLPLEETKSELKSKLADYANRQALQYEREEKLIGSLYEENSRKEKSLAELAEKEFGCTDTELFNTLEPELENTVEKAKASTVAVKTRIGFEITDENKILREFLSPDETKIRAWINLNKHVIIENMKHNSAYAVSTIPGVKLNLETDVTAR
jgi:hypothetical protein